MPVVDPVVIVGGGLAATRVVEEFRRFDGDRRLVLVTGESHLPYDRPPLSKQFLLGDRPTPYLRDDWAELGVDVLLATRAVALHADRRILLLDDGRELRYSALVIATGAEPRPLPGLVGPGVHLLRTVEDATALREDLRRHRKLTVVGGGFIGSEVAATACELGIEVTLVEALGAPLARVLGDEVAAELSRLHSDAGVQLRCGVTVVSAQGEGHDRRLVLSDGSTVEAGVVVVGLGVSPATGWLDGSGVKVDDGIVCDERGRTSQPGVWAAGDVARWRYAGTGEHQRLEHWSSAVNQGLAVARDLVGEVPTVDEVPYFWSDQHGVKLQMLGAPRPDDRVEVLRVGAAADRLVAVYGHDGRVSGALGMGAPRWVMRLRPHIASGAPFDDAVAAVRA
jgi:3-phenylpropionate/trans-cinnamate dioxygenase ferredoxin reductase subunit